MRETAGDRWVASMDGCAADWMVSFARLNEGEASAEVRLRVLPRFAGVLCAAEAPAMIAVDIPIGLPPQAGRGGPAAENMVRPLLGEAENSFGPLWHGF
jgi:predicted RNase H-like nuclease